MDHAPVFSLVREVELPKPTEELLSSGHVMVIDGSNIPESEREIEAGSRSNLMGSVLAGWPCEMAVGVVTVFIYIGDRLPSLLTFEGKPERILRFVRGISAIL
jgi:hypothetical protein